jgi:hypothetical protein
VRTFEALAFSFAVAVAVAAAFLALLFDALDTTGMKPASDLELTSCSLVSTTCDVAGTEWSNIVVHKGAHGDINP